MLQLIPVLLASFETATYARQQLDNCYKAETSISIDPERGVVHLFLFPNIVRECGKFPQGVRFNIKFESQDSLSVDIVDYNFETTSQVDFECSGVCGYLSTVEKSEVTLESARYETEMTPGASTKVRSDFSACLKKTGIIHIEETKVCFIGDLNGVCNINSYTWSGATLEIVFTDLIQEFDVVASHSHANDKMKLCFTTSSAYEVLSAKRPQLFRIMEVYNVNSDVEIELSEETQEYQFVSAIVEFTSVVVNIETEGFLFSLERTDDFELFEANQLATCAEVDYDIYFYLGRDIVSFVYSLSFEAFKGRPRVVICSDLDAEDECISQLQALLLATEVKYGFAHLVFKDSEGAMLHQTRHQFQEIAVTCFQRASFYQTDGGVEVLYDLYREDGKFSVGSAYTCAIGVYDDEAGYLESSPRILFRRSCTAGQRLLLVEFEAAVKQSVTQAIKEAFGMTLLIYDAEDENQLIDGVSSLADRVFETSQRDFLIYAGIVLSITVAAAAASIGVISGLQMALQHRRGKKKIEIKNNLDEM